MSRISQKTNLAIEAYQEANEALKAAVYNETIARRDSSRATSRKHECTTERNEARDRMVKLIALDAE